MLSRTATRTITLAASRAAIMSLVKNLPSSLMLEVLILVTTPFNTRLLNLNVPLTYKNSTSCITKTRRYKATSITLWITCSSQEYSSSSNQALILMVRPNKTNSTCTTKTRSPKWTSNLQWECHSKSSSHGLMPFPPSPSSSNGRETWEWIPKCTCQEVHLRSSLILSRAINNPLNRTKQFTMGVWLTWVTWEVQMLGLRLEGQEGSVASRARTEPLRNREAMRSVD